MIHTRELAFALSLRDAEPKTTFSKDPKYPFDIIKIGMYEIQVNPDGRYAVIAGQQRPYSKIPDLLMSLVEMGALQDSGSNRVNSIKEQNLTGVQDWLDNLKSKSIPIGTHCPAINFVNDNGSAALSVFESIMFEQERNLASMFCDVDRLVYQMA